MTSEKYPLPTPPELKRETMMHDLLIRPMQKADAPFLLPIEIPSFGRFHWNEDSFRNEVSNQVANYFVVIHKPTGQFLGYAGVWFVVDEGHITTLATHPTLRGLGLGELLVTHLYGLAYQAQMLLLTLEVRASNFSAQNLYYKYGFHMVGTRPRYYQDTQEDALLLTTPLLGDAQQVTLVNSVLNSFVQRAGGTWCDGHSLKDAPALTPFSPPLDPVEASK